MNSSYLGLTLLFLFILRDNDIFFITITRTQLLFIAIFLIIRDALPDRGEKLLDIVLSGLILWDTLKEE